MLQWRWVQAQDGTPCLFEGATCKRFGFGQHVRVAPTSLDTVGFERFEIDDDACERLGQRIVYLSRKTIALLNDRQRTRSLIQTTVFQCYGEQVSDRLDQKHSLGAKEAGLATNDDKPAKDVRIRGNRHNNACVSGILHKEPVPSILLGSGRKVNDDRWLIGEQRRTERKIANRQGATGRYRWRVTEGDGQFSAPICVMLAKSMRTKEYRQGVVRQNMRGLLGDNAVDPRNIKPRGDCLHDHCQGRGRNMCARL